jgi:pimeloyl-ACP methyl ester carboxylesterase
LGRELQPEEASRGLTDEEIIHIPGMSSQWVQLANGSRAHYTVSGDSGPAVILAHGGIEGSSGTAGWRFTAPFLGANGFRVYAPDQPGFGWSDTSRPDYIRKSPKDHVDFIKMFADALCLDKFFISGNSMGCATATNVTMAHPDRVLGVVFIAGGLGDVVDPAKRVTPGPNAKFSANPDYVSPGFDGTADSMRVLMEGIIYQAAAIWPELIEMRVKAAHRQREGRKRWGFPEVANFQTQDENILANLSTNGRLQRLQIPMIYMYGLLDVLSPVENGFMQEDACPNIQFFYPDHCGHQGQTDQPDMFNQIMLEFFRDGKVSWETAKWAGVSRRRAINPNLVEAPAGGFPQPIPEKYTDIATLRAEIGEGARAGSRP